MSALWLLLGVILQALLVAASCPPPAVPINCKVVVDGPTATYTCDRGYTLFGSDTRTCKDSSWEGELPVCASNIAYKRPANQSSSPRGVSPAAGNDGLALVEGECAVTQKEESPWWRVDLLQEYEVVMVVVVTRACCESPPLQNLEIRVGNSQEIQKNRLCAWEPGTVAEGERVEYKCVLALRGRYVIIQTVGRESELALCEVEVYSTEEFAKERCSATADLNTLGVFNKTCYQFNVEDGTSFEKAREKCKQTDTKDGTLSISHSISNSTTSFSPSPDLAHSISSTTHNYLTSELERLKIALKNDLIWIGLRKDPGLISRTWRWVDGSIVVESRWGRSQPNNYNGKQDCVALDRGRKWLWNDVGCELDYLPFICMFAPRSCGSPDKKVNTTLEVTGQGHGSQAQYTCPEGSRLVGDVLRTCLESGFWSGSAPNCQYIDCGEPENIENGNYMYTDSHRNTYMAKIAYTCAHNYSLEGAHVRQCGDDAMWMPEKPTCLYARCPPRPAPPHSTTREDSNSHSAGGTITYSCQAGYILKGEATSSCQLGGKWSADPPSCVFTDCGLPPSPPHGQVTLLNKTTTYGSIATYSCGPNYWLSGTDKRLCDADGHWTDSNPECVLITCAEPEVPTGGFVTGYSFQVGSSVEYHCEEGHRIEREIRASESEGPAEENSGVSESAASKGEANVRNSVYVRTCTHDGLWSGSPPMCVYTDCGHVQTVPKASVTYTDGKTHMGAQVTYTCAHGYKLKGNAQRKCTHTGMWSGSSPVCEEIRCQAPPHGPDSTKSDSKNSTFAVLKLLSGNDRRLPSLYGRKRVRERDRESHRIGSVATYECPKGYVINSTTTAAGTTTAISTIATAATTGAVITCTINGTWSGPVPTCSYVDCGLPEKVVNGYYRLLSNTTHFGSQVAYECIDKYKVQGRIRRHCLANSTWAGLSPQCEEIRCPNLTTTLTIGLSVKMEAGGIVDSTADYFCHKGRKIVGRNQRKCNSNGMWSGRQPRCEPVTCHLPPPPENGRLLQLSENLDYGSLVEIHCLPGYILVGPFQRSCMETADWSGLEPQCVGEDHQYTILGDNSIDSSSSTSSTSTTASNTGLYIGLVFGLLLAIVFVAVVVYFRMKQRRGGGGGKAGGGGGQGGGGGGRPPLPPPNEQKTTTMTYSSLTDPITGNNIYENIEGEEEEDGGGGGEDYNNYYNNNNNNHHHLYQNTATTTTATAPATTTTAATTAGINRPTTINSTRRPRLPPPQPPTIPPTTTTTPATTVTINGVTISASV